MLFTVFVHRQQQSDILMGAGASKGDNTPPRRLSLSKSPARGYPNSQQQQQQQQQKRPIRQNNGYDSRSPSPPSNRYLNGKNLMICWSFELS